MNRRLIITAEAETDISDAAVWYDDRARGLGLELISEVQSAKKRAVQHVQLVRFLFIIHS